MNIIKTEINDPSYTVLDMNGISVRYTALLPENGIASGIYKRSLKYLIKRNIPNTKLVKQTIKAK